MKITEIKKTNYNLYQVSKNFLKFNEAFRRIQPKMKRCFICKNSFKDNDSIHLGFFKETKNRILCDKCLTDIVLNHPDVKVIERKKNKGKKI